MLHIVGMKTEKMICPLGMDEPKPRFSFHIEECTREKLEFRIRVLKGKTEVWNSGKQAYPPPLPFISYGGKKPEPFTRYDWTVELFSGKKNCGKASSFFETGFLGTPWSHSKWIMGHTHLIVLNNVVCFFRKFTPGKKITQARLCSTALGLYDARINGKFVSDDILTPGWLDFYTRTLYQVYDVTKLIKRGENVLAMRLAPGWYSGWIGRPSNNGDFLYGQYPELRAELRLTYSDGSTEIIGTDSSFTCPALDESAVRYSDLYQGEICEAWRPEKWIHGISERTIKAQECHDRDHIQIQWQNTPPVRRVQELKAVSITKRAPGCYLLDFGQNCSGHERLTLHNTKQGCAIVVHHGEMLNPDGSLYTENLRTALATTVYTTGTHELEVYEPSFTSYGFRYLEISGWPEKMTKDSVTVQVISSDLAATGHFECSHPLVNRFWLNTFWGQRSNFVDIPSDCPQRDERYGWTGDAQVFTDIASWNMDCSGFYAKWNQDMDTCQTKEGIIGPQIPKIGKPEWSAPPAATGWSDAVIVVPMMLYRKYGDLKTVKESYPHMLAWLRWEWKHTGGPLIDNSRWGDWLNCAEEKIPNDFISTAYFIWTCGSVITMAKAAGIGKDIKELEKMRDAATAALIRKYIAKDGSPKVHTQTAAAMLMVFGILPKDSKAFKKTAEYLCKDIHAHGNCLTTGFLGTPILLPAVTMAGNDELAGTLLTQEKCPSWLYPVLNGATTIWERWTSWTRDKGFATVDMNSFNHFANGAAAAWLFSTLCGIRPVIEFPAFRRFRLEPHPVSMLSHARAEFESPYGKIIAGWQRKGKKYQWEFRVPAGTEAFLKLPENQAKAAEKLFRKQADGSFLVPSGEWNF